jgi:hypothetical protein
MESFDETYRHMFDEELLELAGQANELTPAAERSLRAELQRRGLEAEAARRKQDSSDPAADSTAPDLSKLVSVYSAESEIEGRLVQDLLRASEIESVLRQQYISVVVPRSACEILVVDLDEEKARQIIEEYQRARSLPENETEATDEGNSDAS